MADLLVVVDDIAQMVTAGVVCFAHAHGVVSEVDIAVVAEELRHGCVSRVARASRWVCGGYATVLQRLVRG